MLFNDYPFLLGFLPAAILLYRFADPHPRWRIATLVLLSFVFYSYWNPPFILLLALSIAINWLAALSFARTKRKAIITAAVVFDLAVLGVFKYANFLAYNLGLVLDRPMPHFDIVLPLGISFFTFHHIMYLVDLRRGKAPLFPLGRYALYISFLPQAIDGPLAGRRSCPSVAASCMRRAGSASFAWAPPSSRWACSRRSCSATGSDGCSIRSMSRPGSVWCRTANPG
jgi:alginate O-acetyltransferase complex protein AlgI